MIKNYLKIGFRNLFRNRIFAFINILGLSIGLAASILLLLYVDYEFSYDKHFKDYDLIYRLATDQHWDNGEKSETALAPTPIAQVFKDEFPEIISVTKTTPAGKALFQRYTSDNQLIKSFYEREFLYVDSSFLDVFSLEILAGNPQTALNEPYTMIISESFASKFFDDENPIGGVIRIDNAENYKVTAVYKDMPKNTHIYAQFFLSGLSRDDFSTKNWLSMSLNVYFKANQKIAKEPFEERLRGLYHKYYPWEMEYYVFHIQQFADIHLRTSNEFDFADKGNLNSLYVLLSIAVLILVIASINYMNLSTSRISYRAKEIGLRKSIGATQINLIIQFLGESFLVTLFSMIVAGVLVETFLPYFRELVMADIKLDYWLYFPVIAVSCFVISILSGIYPAFYMARTSPMQSIRGKINSKSNRNINFRKALVIFQFVITIALLISTGVIFNQMRYVSTHNLGFDNKMVIDINLFADTTLRKPYHLRDELKNITGIENITLSNVLPRFNFAGENVIPEGFDTHTPMRTANVDENFIKTLKINMIAGSDFTGDQMYDSSKVILNLAAVKKIGWTPENAIGRKISFNFSYKFEDRIDARVIGVVDNFHFSALRKVVEPVVLTTHSKQRPFVIMKLKPQNFEKTIAEIEKKYSEIVPEYPFKYNFMETDIEAFYKKEQRLNKIVLYFSILAITIACLGLYGLSAFTIEKKNKEIGVKKTYGASSGKIILHLLKDFSIWVLLANIFAYPMAWYIMNKWLQSFAYHSNLSAWIFILASIVTLFLALSTVLSHAYSAAIKNPVDSLKFE